MFFSFCFEMIQRMKEGIKAMTSLQAWIIVDNFGNPCTYLLPPIMNDQIIFGFFIIILCIFFT